MKQVMVDLETLDLGPDALILSIGAVEFAPGNPSISEFYRPVERNLQEKKWGRTVSGNTVAWWSQQSEAAQVAAFADPNRVMLDKALLDFTHWLGGFGAEVWGYGATFDNVVLRNAYKATSLTVPWGWRNDKCFRTLKYLMPDVSLVVPQTGVYHNALDDARNQARVAAELLRRINEWRADA